MSANSNREIRRFGESLPMLLLRARETAMSYFRPSLHEHGLTEQQWRVLRALNEIEELTAAGLARKCVILAPSITRILRKLGNEGLVAVRRSQQDQRERRVRLSDRGRRLIGKIGPLSEAQYDRIRERMHPERLALLYELLHEFIDEDGEERRP